MLVSQVKKALSNQFFRNLGWLGIAELVNRVFRLGTTFVLARVFNEHDFGLMAIVYTTFEFATLIPTRGGIATKIIQSDDRSVRGICDTGYWLQWIICSLTFLLQCVGAFIYSNVSGNEQIFLPLCVAGLAYLVFPMCSNNISLLDRSNRMEVTAACNALQAMIANTTILVLALMGMGVWAVVISILAGTPIWWILSWKANSWRPPKHFTLEHWREIFDFSKNILGVEMLNKLRMNLDYIIINHFLGIKALGIYYFAFNAGSGITLNIVNSMSNAIFTHLCSSRGDRRLLSKNYQSSLKTLFATIVPIVVLQSSLAPIYAPIVYGEQWRSAIPIIMLVCISVIPFAYSITSFLLLNAIDRTDITLRLDLVFTIVFSVALLVAVNFGIYWVAAVVALSNWLVLPFSSIWATRYAFKRR
ncbi:MAG: lipopolysaccharide biosynthesis protein [Xenococcaceae cyanobacterium]